MPAATDLKRPLSELPLVLMAFDRDGVCEACEGGLLERFGAQPDDVVGMAVGDISLRPLEADTTIARCLRGETVFTRDGGQYGPPIDVHWYPRRDAEGLVTGVVAFGTETTEVVGGTVLERAEQEYGALLAVLPDHLFRLFSDGTMVTIKPPRDETWAVPRCAWSPQPVRELLPADVAADLITAAGSARTDEIERVIEYDGRAHMGAAVGERFEARLVPDDEDTVLVMVRDVTQRHRAEREQRTESRLDALGQLAAGLAHEINTPIQFVSDNIEFLGQSFASMHELLLAYRQALDSSERLPWAQRAAELARRERELDVDFLLHEAPQAVEETRAGTRRVATIVRAMKAFSHPAARELAEADLNAAVRDAITVSTSEHKHVADVELDLGDLPPVTCVAGEIVQVVINLVVNSCQELARARADESERGHVLVRTRADGDDAVITVSDDGPGIPASELERVFDAFYTTKEVGQGTGQGLTLIHAIVNDKHGGTVTVRSAPGEGCRFEVRIPVAGPTPAID